MRNNFKKPVTIPKELTPELAEEIGLHIGDGSMNFYKSKNKLRGLYQLRGHISDDKDHYTQRISYLYSKVYGFKPKMREMKSTGVYGFQIWSDNLINFKHKIIGLPLGPKTNISLPKMFIEKQNLLTPLLRGIFDTDGCLYIERKNKKLYPRIEFKTVSNTLATDIRDCLEKLGLRATKYCLLRKEENWNNLYTIAVRGEVMLDKFFKIIQPANPKHIKKFNLYHNKQSESLINNQ